MEKQIKITIRSVNSVQSFKLRSSSSVTIGRVKGDFILKDDYASRTHAAIRFIDSQVLVEDLASQNGVRVNGKKVTSQSISSGDIVRIGQTDLQIQINAVEAVYSEVNGFEIVRNLA